MIDPSNMGITAIIIFVVLALSLFIGLVKIVGDQFSKSFPQSNPMFSYIFTIFFFPLAVFGIVGEFIFSSLVGGKKTQVSVHKFSV